MYHDIHLIVDNVKLIRIGLNPWAMGIPYGIPTLQPEFHRLRSKNVSLLLNNNGEGWNTDLIHQFFIQPHVQIILRLLPSNADIEHHCIWKLAPNGCIPIKSFIKASSLPTNSIVPFS